MSFQVVETVVNAFRFGKPRLADADVPSVAINIDKSLDWTVEFQPGSWTRILNNLVGNALKYTESGLIAILLEIESPVSYSEDLGLRKIRLTVRDTGIGMSTHFISRELYTPFKQANSHAPGTGLGLSIVRRICKDSGAQLNITSELGEGTCATVDMQARFVAKHGASASRGLNVDRFHLLTPTNSAQLNSRSVAPSVVRTAADWLGCKTIQGPSCEDESGSVVYAIAEEDLSAWTAQAKQVDVAGKISHILILGQNMRSVSFEASGQDLPFIPVFVHQPYVQAISVPVCTF